jgi:adenine-specific DNA-methyltransferase
LSAIHDLIAQISDPRLRQRLASEWATASQDRKFGLVFEDHLPELLPLHIATPRRGNLVCLKNGPLKDVWKVSSIRDGVATCIKPSDSTHPTDAGFADVEPKEIPVADLLVVREFGEPIFPSLVPVDKVENGDAGSPWHTLIEADNYHALQLLDYLYAGKVDCIYIDPPYNTGARDWKYNNDYVDSNDGWRHSKWLAFMEKRLKLAKRLLNPESGVLIVTIDEHEVFHLGMLLEQEFPQAYRQLVTIVVNPKGVTQGRFSRVEEYAHFVFMDGAFVKGLQDDLLSKNGKGATKPRWKGLLRSGTNARRQDRDKMFFPILIDPDRHAIAGIGEPLPLPEIPDLDQKIDGYSVAWPIRSDGSLGNWGVGPTSLRALVEKGYVSLGRYDKKRKTWGVSYLSKKLQKQIETGAIKITERDEVRNVVEVVYAEARERQIKTVWHRSSHDAGAYGSDMLRGILGETGAFSFPKSLYAVRDAISAVTLERPNALILDFFAGSGTTLNAVNLLNALDGGNRRCILVTNNEVSAEQAELLSSQALKPGDEAWEEKGICQSVTWPRSKFAILGKRDDGTLLDDTYMTGKILETQIPRAVSQIGFIDAAALNTPAKKKQVVALIKGIPQSLVKEDSQFIVSERYRASILFDTSAAEEWIDALEDQDHITDLYVVTPDKKLFENLKGQIHDVLGPILLLEDECRPMSKGFPANLEYFKLSFLDKDRVALKRAFREILPLLWMMAGSYGSRPHLPDGSEPAVFAPEERNFAVLLDETRMLALMETVAGRTGLSHVFIVTDADESFRAMAADVVEALKPQNENIKVVQLYRDYLTNFMINQQRESATSAVTGDED